MGVGGGHNILQMMKGVFLLDIYIPPLKNTDLHPLHVK